MPAPVRFSPINRSLIRAGAILTVLASFAVHAANLTWDAMPTTASPGPNDGAGNWGVSANNTNWWNGAANVPWNNANEYTAVLGVVTNTAYTVTITNGVTVGGIIFSNLGSGAITVGTSGGSVLAFTGSSPSIQLGCASALNVISAPVVAPNGLSVMAVTTNETSISLRLNAATNDIVGSLIVGTPGNASYTTPTGLYVDINGSSLNPMVLNLTNVTVYSNATLRISGANSGYTLSPFPQQITISGDGLNGGLAAGAYDITGNAGGTVAANMVLAGDSTIDFNVGASGQTFTLNGVISGAGRLQLVCGNSAANKNTCALTNASTYLGKTIVGGGTTLQLINGNNRLPVTTALTLGISGALNNNWNDYGRLVLGNSTLAVNQMFTGLNCPSGIANPCWVAGGNATTVSILTVSNATDNYFAGALGGGISPANNLALVKNGAGNLQLTGTNGCAGGLTINAGRLTFGDGNFDSPISGPITNNAMLVFNVASGQRISNAITGSGTLTKQGGGTLLLNGTNSSPGLVTVSNGALGGNGVIAGPVSVLAGGTLSPSGLGPLTISNTLILSGTTVMEVNKNVPTNDLVRGLTSVSYGGTLIVSNLGSAYAPGDRFKLFDAASYSGGFTSLIPSTPGPGNGWDTSQLVTSGTLAVIVATNNVDHPPYWTTNPLTGSPANPNTTYTGSLAGDAGDPDAGDTLTFSKVSGPAWLTVAANGALGGAPGSGDVGADTFTVRVTDAGGLSSDTTLMIQVFPAVAQLSSPDGTLTLSFALSNFDGSVSCPVYSLSLTGQTLIATSKLGLTFGSGLLQQNLNLISEAFSTNNSTWQPVYGERSSIANNYHQLVATVQETVLPNRLLQLTFRAYNEGAAFCYTIPAQANLAGASNLTEQTEFRFAANYTTWATYTAQGVYSQTTISGITSGCERPLPVQLATNLYVAVGEARLVDYSRMKFGPLSGKPDSLVSVLDNAVNSSLPFTTPWRFILPASRPGQLMENDFLVLNLNDPCALTNTAWIKPGKVIRESTLTTTGGLACVDFAVKHHLQYVEFDAGWYGPESTTLTATNVNVDPSRSPGPLDLHTVINYGTTNGIGIILYVNWLAMTNELGLLPPLYKSWGVRGIKYGFVGNNTGAGLQQCVEAVNEAARICATNQIMMEAHDEFRPSGYTQTYPNLMTLEGIAGDETTPSTANDTTEFFSRMLVGGADHTVCYFDARVTNNWSYAYQLAKAVCFYSPWQYLYWYDRPTNSYAYVSGAPDMITEVPELEFYAYMPTVWDETRVLQSSISQYAVIARRTGTDWYLGAMNASSTRTFNLPLDFLTPGQEYIQNVYSQDPSVPTHTHVRIDRFTVDSTATLSMTLGASSGEAVRWTPAIPPTVQSLSLPAGGGFCLASTGHLGAVYSLRSSTNLTWPATNWTLLAGTNLISASPFTNLDLTATNQPRQFYRFSAP